MNGWRVQKHIFLAVGHSAVNDQNFLVSGRVELGKEMENTSAEAMYIQQREQWHNNCKESWFQVTQNITVAFSQLCPALKKITYHQKMLRWLTFKHQTVTSNCKKNTDLAKPEDGILNSPFKKQMVQKTVSVRWCLYYNIQSLNLMQ